VRYHGLRGLPSGLPAIPGAQAGTLVRASADGLTDRLERIEQTVEATAIEVERISEANRFMAKLLADRAEPGRPLVKPERVIAPH
jgi:hypothetical protein